MLDFSAFHNPDLIKKILTHSKRGGERKPQDRVILRRKTLM
jgi:hypothetical protein